MTPFLSRLAPLMLALGALPGCFVFVDDIDDDEPAPAPDPVIVNHVPFIDEAETFWLCDFDAGRQDYAFEFQALVVDDDGWRDVQGVDVTVTLADDPGYVVGAFSLVNEGQGFFGGLVWESESDLFCGEPIDVLFEAWDSYGDEDWLLLRY